MRQTLRALTAEFVGVFILVFIGGGAIIINTLRPDSLGLVGIALAYGLAYGLAVTTALAGSGGHVNPAVTIGLWSVGRIAWRRAGLYVLAQLAGAVVAALVLEAVFPGGAGQVAQYGAVTVATEISTGQAVAVEGVLTFFLALAMMATVVDTEAPRLAGWGLGLTVLIGVLTGGPLTGAALNPARALGPAIVSSFWTAQAVYWIGPIVGAIVAMQVYERVLRKKD